MTADCVEVVLHWSMDQNENETERNTNYAKSKEMEGQSKWWWWLPTNDSSRLTTGRQDDGKKCCECKSERVQSRQHRHNKALLIIMITIGQWSTQTNKVRASLRWLYQMARLWVLSIKTVTTGKQDCIRWPLVTNRIDQFCAPKIESNRNT